MSLVVVRCSCLYDEGQAAENYSSYPFYRINPV